MFVKMRCLNAVPVASAEMNVAWPMDASRRQDIDTRGRDLDDAPGAQVRKLGSHRLGSKLQQQLWSFSRLFSRNTKTHA